MKLLRGVVSGVTWSAASRAGEQAVAVLSTVVLAWLLDPADFGVLGMATVATGFVTLVSDVGMPQALVQRKESPAAAADTFFWITVAFGITGATGLV
ncbi:MAG: oligosaccharide flippase family protein, partial [Gemmatimonadota bacterium]